MSDAGPSTGKNRPALFALGLIARNRRSLPFSAATQPPFREAAKAASSMSIFIRDTCTGAPHASIGDSRAHQRGAA